MSMNRPNVSSSARGRIRSFSTWVWVWGSIVLCIGAFTTYSDIGIGDNGFGSISDTANPWEVADPAVFEPDGDTYSGERNGLIRIPADEHNMDPYVLRLVVGEYTDIFVTDVEDLDEPDNDRSYPTNVGYLYDVDDELLVLPPDGDLELWVRSDGPWEFTLAKEDVTEITDGYVSGKGNGFFVYRGEAVSARFIHQGDGLFFVTVQMPGERSDQPIIETGDVNQRLSWDPTSAVYFSIESDDDRGAWSVDIDELATDAPAGDPTDTPVEREPDPTDTTEAPVAAGTAASTLDPVFRTTRESTLR